MSEWWRDRDKPQQWPPRDDRGDRIEEGYDPDPGVTPPLDPPPTVPPDTPTQDDDR